MYSVAVRYYWAEALVRERVRTQVRSASSWFVKTHARFISSLGVNVVFAWNYQGCGRRSLCLPWYNHQVWMTTSLVPHNDRVITTRPKSHCWRRRSIPDSFHVPVQICTSPQHALNTCNTGGLEVHLSSGDSCFPCWASCALFIWALNEQSWFHWGCVICSAARAHASSTFRAILPRRGRGCSGCTWSYLKIFLWITNSLQTTSVTSSYHYIV